MSDQSDDLGTMQAMLDRLLHFRLPRTLELKQRIDGGERLSDTDLAFLKEALEDARRGQQFIARNPEFHHLGVQIVQLYEDIVRKAAENEKQA